MKFTAILFVVFCSLSSLAQAAGSAAAAYRQTQVPYADCVENVKANIDVIYKVSNVDVLSRKDDKVTLRHTGRLGQSCYVSQESHTVKDNEQLFETKMIQCINGTLQYQRTLIQVKNVDGKACITVTMEACVNHFFASERSIREELDKCIRETIWKIEVMKKEQK